MPCPLLIASIMRRDGETGVQTHFRAFLAWLDGRRLEARLATPYDSPLWQVYPVFALRRLIDPLHRASSVWWYRHWHRHFLCRALRGLLADGSPRTIYAQCPLSADAALRARTTPAQRVVMVVHFNLSQADEWAGKGMIRSDGRLFRAIRRFEADVLPRLDGLVFVSEFMRRELAARIPAVAAVPYRVIPNFLADPGSEAESTRPASDLICIGTLEARKNQRYAIEIVAAAEKLGRSLTLTLVGDGPDRQSLEALTRAMGVVRNVRFAGFVAQAAALIADHRACLHVAQVENLPLTLIEALSRGRPVFAPAVGGVPEVFADGVEGCLIPLGQPEDAAKRIIQWLDDEAAMARAGQAARRRFVDRFEAERVGAALHGFLAEAAS